MIKLTEKNNRGTLSGSLNMGYMGVFSDELIELDDDYRDDIEARVISLEEVQNTVNALEKNIQKHINNINNVFLLNAMDDMIDSGYEYWNVEGFGSEPLEEEWNNFTEQIGKWHYEYFDAANDGSQGIIPDVEKFIRESLPSFDLDFMLRHIKPECLFITPDSFAVQFTSDFEGGLFVSAYTEIMDDLSLTDWTNG